MEGAGTAGVLEYAADHDPKPAASRGGLDRKTVRQWRDRARETGAPGFVPRYPKRRYRRIPAEVVELIAHAWPGIRVRRLSHAPLAHADASGEGTASAAIASTPKSSGSGMPSSCSRRMPSLLANGNACTTSCASRPR